MSFLDYLHDNRGVFIDHRVTPPASLAASSWDSTDLLDADTAAGTPPAGSRARRRRGSKAASAGATRFRHVRPAFAPSPYSDPLPYEEPWERAFR
ncbi:MAG: hypothetical protein H7287_02070 [Thermoleophilia bacterium]|nr:hypothetical protein [Thermoleophilia bacterium]